jgi:type IV pilus assembly protein PilV
MQQLRQQIKVQTSSGITLIEVLATVVILSIGLLGLAEMHFHGLKNNQSSYFRSQATILAYTILDRMRANRVDALNGDYNFDSTASAGSCTTSGTTTAKIDLDYWKCALNSALPSGNGAIDCKSTTSVCKVTVQWDDSIGIKGSTSQQFIVATEL